ncbi:MAG: hypothetical protein WKF97_24085 [Chitinophagaceae bacterium]
MWTRRQWIVAVVAAFSLPVITSIGFTHSFRTDSVTTSNPKVQEAGFESRQSVSQLTTLPLSPEESLPQRVSSRTGSQRTIDLSSCGYCLGWKWLHVRCSNGNKHASYSGYWRE